jgi:hypothetical protein
MRAMFSMQPQCAGKGSCDFAAVQQVVEIVKFDAIRVLVDVLVFILNPIRNTIDIPIRFS